MILKWWMWQFYEYTSSIKIVDAPFSRVGSILTVLVNFTVIAGVEFRRKHMYNQYDPRMWKIPCQLLDYAKNSLSRKMHSLLTFTIDVAFFHPDLDCKQLRNPTHIKISESFPKVGRSDTERKNVQFIILYW